LLNEDYNDYYFDKHGYRFIGMDSGSDYNCSNPFGGTPEGDGLEDSQYNRLNEADMKDRPKIIFMHHPIVDPEEDGLKDGDPPVTNNCPQYGGNDACIAFNRCEFINYCIRHNVDIVLTGHTHEDFENVTLEIDYPDIPEIWTHTTWFIQTRSATKDPDPYNRHGYRVIKITDKGVIPYMSEMTENTLKDAGSERYTYWATSDVSGVPLIHVVSDHKVTGMIIDRTIWREIPNSYYTGVLDEFPQAQTIVCYDKEPDRFVAYFDDSHQFTKETMVCDLDTTSQKAMDEGSVHFNITMKHQTENITTKYIYENITLGASENASAIVDLNSTNVNYTMEIDYDGDGVTDNTTDPTHILINYAPNISITTPAGDQSGNVTISYNLKDAESDNCTIMAQYSLDNITWLDAGVGGDGMINLTSTPAGVDHTFVWASGTDIPHTNAIVYFRIRPYDGDLAGDYATTGEFSVDNRVRGDLNHDGNVTSADAAIALQIAVSGEYVPEADIDGNGCVTSLDALMIMQAAAGRIAL
jgi:hypothetical protein